MRWNWQQPDWPNFSWDAASLAQAEERFLLGAGALIGIAKHLGADERIRLTVETMSEEALTTSRIEGEMLDRDSVQSSIQRQLGLFTDTRRIKPAEQGIAELMIDLYRTIPHPLTRRMLCGWQGMIVAGRRDLRDIGRYRTNPEPMQVISAAGYEPKVHFEAPPSKSVPAEMTRFLGWFNRTAPGGKQPLPALTRAGLAHIYFESIHPFEDGNGRVGRAISEKALIQGFGEPAIVGLATAILAHQRGYYKALEVANKRNDATDWLLWFAQTALDAQRRTAARIEFVLAKTRLLDRLRDQLNPRQSKAILRMLEEGPEGFKGGLSAGNYSSITGAPSATTTRDLADLVEQGALSRTGERRHARYHLVLTPS